MHKSYGATGGLLYLFPHPVHLAMLPEIKCSVNGDFISAIGGADECELATAEWEVNDGAEGGGVNGGAERGVNGGAKRGVNGGAEWGVNGGADICDECEPYGEKYG